MGARPKNLPSDTTNGFNPAEVQAISTAGNHCKGMLEFMENNNDILFSQRGVYKENSGGTKYDRNVWKYDPWNLNSFTSINPQNPTLSYLFGEIKRGIDGNYYVPQMGAPMDKIHSYSNGNWSSLAVPATNTVFNLWSSLPTQVFKIFDDPSLKVTEYKRTVGNKNYELKDHIRNVRTIISDAKIIVDNGTSQIIDNNDTYIPEVKGYNDYYAFGQSMPRRNWTSSDYRYGFNGFEKVDEIYGSGNAYDMGARSSAASRRIN